MLIVSRSTVVRTFVRCHQLWNVFFFPCCTCKICISNWSLGRNCGLEHLTSFVCVTCTCYRYVVDVLQFWFLAVQMMYTVIVATALVNEKKWNLCRLDLVFVQRHLKSDCFSILLFVWEAKLLRKEMDSSWTAHLNAEPRFQTVVSLADLVHFERI